MRRHELGYDRAAQVRSDTPCEDSKRGPNAKWIMLLQVGGCKDTSVGMTVVVVGWAYIRAGALGCVGGQLE